MDQIKFSYEGHFYLYVERKGHQRMRQTFQIQASNTNLRMKLRQIYEKNKKKLDDIICQGGWQIYSSFKTYSSSQQLQPTMHSIIKHCFIIKIELRYQPNLEKNYSVLRQKKDEMPKKKARKRN